MASIVMKDRFTCLHVYMLHRLQFCQNIKHIHESQISIFFRYVNIYRAYPGPCWLNLLRNLHIPFCLL